MAATEKRLGSLTRSRVHPEQGQARAEFVLKKMLVKMDDSGTRHGFLKN